MNKELNISIEQLGAIFEVIPVAICITTIQDGTFIYVNAYFEKLFACKRKNVLNKKSTELNILSIEDRNQIIKKVFETGSMKNVKTELTILNKRKINVIISIEKIELEKNIYFITTITDITDKLKSNNEIKVLNKEKQNRADELGIANIELAHQQSEKQNRADELGIANIELAHQQSEKQNRADELGIANKELNFQKKLAQKQAYTRSLIEASRDPMVTLNTSGKIMDMNQAMLMVTDKKREQLINSNFYLNFTDQAKAKKVYQKVFENGFVTNYPLTIKDGKLTDVLFNGSVFKDEKGKVIGAVIVARDVSEQKKLERNLIEYKHLFNENLDFACIASSDGFFEVVNKSFENVLGYTELELLNTSFLDFLHPDDLKITKNELRNLKNGNRTLNFINRYLKKDGNYLLLDWKANFNKDTNKIYAIARDITDQKILEQELIEAKVFAELATTIAEESRNSAQEAVKAKQQFLSNMSHEIRTPMNAIIGFTTVVLKTQLTAKQKEYLMAIKMSGDALIVLINDILDLAKVDSGKMTFEKSPFKLSSSIASILHLFETKIQEKNLKLIINYDDKIPEILIGDQTRLHQIILNLVSNAVKFTNQGIITTNINLISQNDKKATIKFEVQDTGIGIKSAKIGTIFENFQQAANTTSRLYGGTGLGLAIVKQLVEAQGGKIDIKSQFNKGSTFSFELDFEKTTIEIVHEPEIQMLGSCKKNIKILVVEDIELNQLLMKTLLDDFGYECDITANGKLAIEKLKTHSYDIILMDLQMPEMNGFEATEYIRKKMKLSIPIIALTADVTTVDLEKCKAIGMDDYIAKPIDERLLYSKLLAFSKKPIAVIEHIKGQNHLKDTVKYIDMSYLTKLTKSNPVLIEQMINAYLKQTPILINIMKKSIIKKDWKMLQSAIHKIIPSFSIVGFSQNIHEIAKRIQDYAFSIEITQEINNLVLELEKVCTQSCEELQLELQNLKKLSQVLH